jgi:hypothetical protein
MAPPSVRLPFHLQRTPRTITETEASGLRGSLLPPPDRFAEACQHKLRRGIAAIGLIGVEELLNNDRLGLIDDHAPRSVAVRLKAREQLDTASKSPRQTAKSTSCKTHISEIEIQSCPDSVLVLFIGTIGQRCEVRRQILDLRLGRTGAGAPQGMISPGGLRFWPAETRSPTAIG